MHAPPTLRRRFAPLLFIGLLFAAAGCGSSPEDAGPWELGADAGEDGHPDAEHPDPDMPTPDTGTQDTSPTDPTPEPVTFRLVNDSNQPVRYIEPGCRPSDAEWRQIRVDTSVEGSSSGGGSGGSGNTMASARMEHDPCRGCRCSEASSGDSCGRNCFVCRTGQTTSLQPGDEVTYEWSGTYLRASRTDDGQDCQRQYEARPGQSIAAEICWYTGDEKPASEVDPECAPVSFDMGETDTVEHVVEPTDTEPTTFRLQNNSRNDVFVRRLTTCQTTATDWLRVGHVLPTDGFDRYRVTSLHCSDCQCSSVEESGNCSLCNAVCRPGGYARLPAGEAQEYEWNGPMYTTDTVEGQSCLRREQPAEGTDFRARFCWVETDADGNLPDNPGANLRCRPVRGGLSFGYGEGETVTQLVTREE